MTTVLVTKDDKMLFQKNLADAINSISFNKIDLLKANDLAIEAVKSIDFSNSALAHKGVNWFAKKIVNAVYKS